MKNKKADRDRAMSPLTILRTDTVFAKLPIHNLTKSAAIDIRINQLNAQGIRDLYWRVSPSVAYGPPQLLAYKLDTLVINRRLDALKRPLPSVICLGSLRQICEDLGLSKGKATSNLKRALYQNAGVFVTAKLRYRDLDGHEQRLEAGFNRYGVVFTGESLPDGSRADAVYIILHEVYRHVLNSAPTRPIDYDYLTDLKPLAQRFYELLSFKMYAALKYQHPQVSMRYSELCQFAPQLRHTDGKEMSKQMSRVHQPHLQSGYLREVRTERVVDLEGYPDWLLLYTPGSKAHAEFQVYTGSTRQHQSSVPVAAGRDELEVDVSDGSEVAAPKPSVCGHQAMASARPTPSVTERITRDESPTADPESAQSAAELVRRFYCDFYAVTDKAPHSREIEHAERLLVDHGQAFAVFFLAFAKRAAKQEGRTVHVFGGLLRYETAALDAYHRQQARRAKTSVEAAEALEQQSRQHYARYCQEQAAIYRATLSSDRLAALKDEIRAELGPMPRYALKAQLQVELDYRLAQQAGVPPFDEWRQQQEVTSHGN